MTPSTEPNLVPGQRIAVTQQIPRQGQTYTVRTEGVISSVEQRKTGSWFAHAKDHRLWLDRIAIRKDDGEIVIFNLDPLTHIDLLDADSHPGDDQPST